MEMVTRKRQNNDYDTIVDASDPIPTTGASVEWVKPQKIALTSTPQEVTLDDLVGMQITSRGSAIISCSLFGNEDGVAQVETNTLLSGVDLGGDLDVTITAVGMTGTPATITASVLGTLQVDTSVATTGAVTASGNITLEVTAAGMTGSPHDVVVPVVLADDTDAVALACRTALAADAVIALFFDVSGTGANIILTNKIAVADDATTAIAFDDTDTTGAVVGASSQTTAGVAASTVAECAEIVKDAINADGVMGAFFTATRSGNGVILTAAASAANDTTMNLAVEIGTATGFTDVLTSENTTEGYASGGDWDEIGGQGTLNINPPPMATNSSPFTSIWMKTTTTVNAMVRGWKAV